jgi:hypothetical protein
MIGRHVSRGVWIILGVVTLSVLSHGNSLAQEVNGRVSAVTLYRGQAQVTRVIPLEGDPRGFEVVVGELPEQIVPDSVFAEGGEAVEIRAVRFRTRAVGEQPRDEVRALDREILEAQRQIELNQKRNTLLQVRAQYLTKLEGFVAPTAQSDLAKGVLDAVALERISNYSFSQRERIAEEEVQLARTAYELNEQLQLLHRKRAEITGGASRTVREAVLFVRKNAPGPADVRLNYLVNNCGWSPTYTMRAGADRRQVRVEYNALIHQLTGEEWRDVNLTLSTASPALSAAGPGLAPFHVVLAPEAVAQVPPNAPSSSANVVFDAQQQQFANAYGRGLSKEVVLGQVRGLNTQRNQMQQALNNSGRFAEQNNFTWTLNDLACSLQQLEINGDATTLAVLRRDDIDEANGPSLSYQLPGGVSLASRSDQQMVRIMASDLNSRFYHTAVPVLAPYVYREAELMNSSNEDLLAGPMTVYLDNRFVGRSELPTVARGQTFVVGFGADAQLRARRELADKADRVQGGNRETRFDYRLVVENFTSEATPVRVMDRLPNAERGADVRVSLGDTSDAVSTDKLYVRRERPMGILRWDVEVPANAAGENAKIINYQYTVEYDRQYVVSLPASKQTLQDEFNRLQEDRRKQ